MKQFLTILALTALAVNTSRAQSPDTDAVSLSESSVVGGETAAASYDTRRIFLYSPNPNAGLHIAFFGNGRWNEMGQLCSSDYGA